jgi:hypothetical protein
MAIRKKPMTLDKLAQLVGAGFGEMDKRFESMDKRFGSIDKRFETIDERFEVIDKRFESIEKRFEARFQSIENRMATKDDLSKMEDKILESLSFFMAKFVPRFIDLTEFEERISRLEKRAGLRK